MDEDAVKKQIEDIQKLIKLMEEHNQKGVELSRKLSQAIDAAAIERIKKEIDEK